MDTASDYFDAFQSSWEGVPSMSVPARQIQCFTLFEAQGFPPEAAAAWVGNAVAESGPELPTAFRTAGLDHGSQGLLQWRLDRLLAYESFVQQRVGFSASAPGADVYYGRMDYQVEFAAQECRDQYPELYATLMAGGDVDALTAAICWQYERPAVATAHLALRQSAARNVLAAAPSLSGHAPTVATQLNHTVVNAGQTARGAAAGATGAVVAASTVVGTHVSWHMPTWGWVALVVFGIIAVFGVLTALAAASTKATTKALLATPTPATSVPAASPGASSTSGAAPVSPLPPVVSTAAPAPATQVPQPASAAPTSTSSPSGG